MAKIVVANWKMHPATEAEVVRLARATDRSSVVLCPPFPFLLTAKRVMKRAKLGAQDVFWRRGTGAYTGEISSTMLRRIGVRYVIVGHSERREHCGETDSFINLKVRAAIAEGLTVILCVGEPLAVRRKGIAAAKRFVETQLHACLRGVSQGPIIIAYEPVWSISTSGTGQVDTPEEAAEIIRCIRRSASTKVIYGGSVNEKNATGFLHHRDIDGVLVGGASLVPRALATIISAAH